MNQSFWTTLPKPIIGLSPMDGVTDAAFREIIDIYGHPDVLYTEFVPVEALEHGSSRVLNALRKHRTTTPIVAQIFGSTLSAYYLTAFIIPELGFDGIDINMGCPDKHVVLKGGGAALIKNQKLAQAIVRTVTQAVEDWVNGRTLASLHLPEEILAFIKKYSPAHTKRTGIPVSVKTRIGYDTPITNDWIRSLIEASPDLITLHGRTLLQMYTGKANWDEIGKAALLCKKNGVMLFGNGDIHSLAEARAKAADFSPDGVLIGRGALGNPWIFSEKTVSWQERTEVMKHHARLFLRYRPDLNLIPMRKHFTWYCNSFNDSAKIRNQLMNVTSPVDLHKILSSVTI